MVASVSLATSGETSTETYPSPPPVRSQTGRNTSQPAWISAVIRAVTISTVSAPRPANSSKLVVVVVAPGDGAGEDRRVRCDSGHRILIDEASQFAARQHRPRELIAPDRLPQCCDGMERRSHDSKGRRQTTAGKRVDGRHARSPRGTTRFSVTPAGGLATSQQCSTRGFRTFGSEPAPAPHGVSPSPQAITSLNGPCPAGS